MKKSLPRKVFLGALAVPLQTRVAAAETYSLRLALTGSTADADGQTVTRFAAAVARRSNGQLKVEIFPNGQLAGQAAMLDGLQTGVVDFALSPSTNLETLLPPFSIFSMPFLFKDVPAVYRVLNGSIGDELFASLEPHGILGLAWGNAGFKQLESVPKAIAVPEDMKGMRVRIAGGQLTIATYQSLGGLPVQIDANEIYTAMTQRTIDCVDLPFPSFTDRKLYTVAKNVSMSNHFIAVNPILGSKRKIEALPAPLQQIVRQEARGVMPFWRYAVAQQTADKVAELKRNGIGIGEIQFPAFRKAVQPVYALLQQKLGGNLLERVARVASGPSSR